MELNKSWLDTLLKKKNSQESVIKVNSIEVTDALGKGENYLSLIKRVKAEVVLGSGRKKKLSLIVKQEYETPLLRHMSVSYGYFAREIGMYRDILPKMEDLMDEVGDAEEPLWGKCLDVRLFDRIVFEDLNARGYVMAERHKQLNFPTAAFVLKCLGKFHALGAVLNEKLQIPSDLYWKHPWSKMMSSVGKHFQGNLFKLANAMENWGEEWKEAKVKLDALIPSYWTKIEKYFTTTYDGFKVLIHGDCWTNNFLLKYEIDSESPTSMKFIDLQLSCITTPAHDLHWFLVSSVPLETRKSRLDDLLEIYAESLKTHLHKLGYAGEPPTSETVKEEYRKNRFLALFFGSILAAPVLNDKKDALDIEDMVKKGAEAEEKGSTDTGYNVYSNLSEGAINLLKHEIREAFCYAAD